jgi:hypothetical protein
VLIKSLAKRGGDTLQHMAKTENDRSDRNEVLKSLAYYTRSDKTKYRNALDTKDQ